MSGGAESPVSTLRGVGPARARALADVGVVTIADLLARFPRRVRLLPPPVPIADVVLGETATVLGLVKSRRTVRSRGRRSHLRARIEDDSGALDVLFYNQGFLESSLAAGAWLRASGQLSGSPAVFVPVRYAIDPEPSEDGELVVEHAPVPGVRPRELERLTREAARRFAPDIEDPVPDEVRRRRELTALGEAIITLHDPADATAFAAADDRVVYNGFLAAALRVESTRAGERLESTPTVEIDAEHDARLRARIPFTLTPGQERAVADVREDLSSSTPMRRLVQGDVGSGKTVVAAYAVMAAAEAGRQAAILAPTDALARQLHAVVSSFSRGAGWPVVLLAGAVPRAARREIAEMLERGEPSITVGTHALVERSVRFSDLALVVVDEQHRFGVRQRLELVRKGVPPHLLAMSATPIPRSLAMTAYADLRHSIIRDRPPGRGEVVTEVWAEKRQGPFDWEALTQRLSRGGRAFIVYPAIDSEDERFPSLLRHGREQARRYFKGLPVAALHGRMTDEEKSRSLEGFRKGDVQALFSTTVIEVGVDVPEATEIVIVGAERFGLAQLHQLRGRVGRGRRAGRCALLTATKSDAARERLEALASSSDGFEIAERDLELRGPGDIMGLRQHGHGGLPFGRDEEELLLAAFEDARAMLERGCDVEAVRRLEAWTRRRPSRSREFVQAG